MQVRETAFSGDLFGLGEDAELCGEAPEASARKEKEMLAAAAASGTLAPDAATSAREHLGSAWVFWGVFRAPVRGPVV